MRTSVSAILIGVGAFAAAFAAVLMTGDGPPKPVAAATGSPPQDIGANKAQPKCDSPDTLETLRSLATTKIRTPAGVTLFLARGSLADMKTAADLRKIEFSFTSFRDRGALGSGRNCAALGDLWYQGQVLQSMQFSTEYSVEPTSDGKTIVSARFMPN